MSVPPFPTESWSDDECGMAVVFLHDLIGRETCIRIASMASDYMDHARVMDYFATANLPPPHALALAKSVEAYIREARRLRTMN